MDKFAIQNTDVPGANTGLPTPEAFYLQQRRNKDIYKSPNSTKKAKASMAKYARIKSARYNLDLRAEQLKLNQEVAAKISNVNKPMIRDDEDPREFLERKQAHAIKIKEKTQDVGIYMENLNNAISSNNSKEINESILKTFFTEMGAPERMEEIPSLLQEYEGKEAELFDILKEEHPMNNNEDLEGEDLEDLEKFKQAFDASLEEKKNAGEFVLNIVANGGQWWINRNSPSQHSSQRKRETFLPELRARKDL